MEMERCCRRRPAIDFITLVLLLFIVAYLCFSLSDANPNLVAHFPAAPRRIESGHGAAFMLPLSSSSAAAEEEFPRGSRELVADARMTLHDDLLTKGYYTSRVFIGTPPQEFALIVDTGSTVTYVPCSSCTHCGPHQDPQFKPDNSSSYAVVQCNTPECKTGRCGNNKQCRYERMYAEMSTSSGILGKDQIGFGQDSQLGPQALLFGCETRETGDLYSQRADGIMGLGRGPLSLVDQLVGSGAMADSFSLCYGGMEDGGGAMILGAIPPLPDMVFTPSDPTRSNYYNLPLKEIQVQGVPLKVDASIFDKKYGTVLDSGTTYAYLPSQAFDAFEEAVIQQLGSLQAVDGPDPTYHDICYAGAGTDPGELYKHFPSVDFVFDNNMMMTLAPENYLFKHTKIPGAYCLGIFKNQDPTTLLGGIVVRNMLVTYDRANQQIGFLRTNCSNLWSILPPEPPTVPPAPGDNQSSPSDSTASASHNEGTPPFQQTASPANLSVQEVGSVELIMALATNYSTFSNQSSVFLSGMAKGLDVLLSQVSLLDFQEENNQVIVQWVIAADPPAHRLSTRSAQVIVTHLQDHQVSLPEVFGTYDLRSWKFLPLSRWSWLFHHRKFNQGVIIAALVGVILFLAATCSLVYWYIWRYKDKDTVKYTNVEQATDEETL